MTVEGEVRAIAREIIRSASSPGERLAMAAERLYMLGIAEVPRASNDGRWIRWFMWGDRGLAWCAGFLLRLMMILGCPMPSCGYWRGRRVDTWMKAAKKDGTFMGGAIEPGRGDVVFWDNRRDSDAGIGGHVDVIVQTKRVGEDLRLTIIGGNVDHRIAQRVVSHRDPQILGYGRLVEPLR